MVVGSRRGAEKTTLTGFVEQGNAEPPFGGAPWSTSIPCASPSESAQNNNLYSGIGKKPSWYSVTTFWVRSSK